MPVCEDFSLMALMAADRLEAPLVPLSVNDTVTSEELLERSSRL
ncbi:hypothetical protein Talka_02335 [Tepidimonas alkaliphilus]|uniref:Uncharacterized protein n=1 Tax=Tepidimonas alkaliphilus TaxID=2588942 RepID=A0A554W3L2_9BURK|nr:hypothetical protein Talka_02335 [Tepidimonas alkaliphilus]